MRKDTTKTQKVTLTFERNGSKWGMVKDCVQHTFDLELPEGFIEGVHVVGAKTGDKLYETNGITSGSEPTGWVTMVAEVLVEKDIEKMVGKILTIVDATMLDKDQREAFKSLIKQAMYGQYNRIRERSYQVVQEPPVLIGTLDD
jgi:hypothetical protein